MARPTKEQKRKEVQVKAKELLTAQKIEYVQKHNGSGEGFHYNTKAVATATGSVCFLRGWGRVFLPSLVNGAQRARGPRA